MPKEIDRSHRANKKKERPSQPGSDNKREGTRQALRTETYRRRSSSKGIEDRGLRISHPNRQKRKLSKVLRIKDM